MIEPIRWFCHDPSPRLPSPHLHPTIITCECLVILPDPGRGFFPAATRTPYIAGCSRLLSPSLARTFFSDSILIFPTATAHIPPTTTYPPAPQTSGWNPLVGHACTMSASAYANFDLCFSAAHLKVEFADSMHLSISPPLRCRLSQGCLRSQLTRSPLACLIRPVDPIILHDQGCELLRFPS